MIYLKFSSKILIPISLVTIIVSISLIASADRIHPMSDDFSTTLDQRKEYYPSSWHFKGLVGSTWEVYSTDELYVYFTNQIVHSYTVDFTIELVNNTHTKITFTSITTDDRGYGYWEFDIAIYNSARTQLYGRILNFTSSESVIIPESDCYYISLSGFYKYIACTVYYEGSCIYIDISTEYIQRTSSLDLKQLIWDEIHQGFEQLLWFLSFSIIGFPYFIEFMMNYKDRKKNFNVAYCLLLVGYIVIIAISLSSITSTLKDNKATEMRLAGYQSSIFFFISSILLYWFFVILEKKSIKKQKITASSIQYKPPSSIIDQPHSSIYQQQPIGNHNKDDVEISFQDDVEIPFQDDEDIFFFGSTKHCHFCGEKIPENNTFCTKCGSKQ